MIIEEVAYEAFRKINFSKRFKQIVNEFNNFESNLYKTNKKEVLKLLNNLGFNFTFCDGAYINIEQFDSIKFQITLNIKGNVLCTLYIWYKGELINLVSGHFTFVRNKLESIEEFIAPNFSNYEDLEKILSALLSIYEDFKREFLKQVNEQQIV